MANRFVHRHGADGAMWLGAGVRVVANRLSTGTGPVEQYDLPSHGTKPRSKSFTLSWEIDRVLRSPVGVWPISASFAFNVRVGALDTLDFPAGLTGVIERKWSRIKANTSAVESLWSGAIENG